MVVMAIRLVRKNRGMMEKKREDVEELDWGGVRW
jgi:hypothetical protein